MPFSVIDACAVLRPITGNWFFEHIDIPRLLAALQDFIDTSPFWCGQTRFANYMSDGGPYERFRYPELAYNFDTDPGVEVGIAEVDKTWLQLMSELETIGDGATIALNCRPYLPTQDKPHPPFSDLPTLRIKISKFKCGVIGIGLAMPHCLSDVWTMQVVMECWSKAFNGNLKPMVFKPRDVDEIALPFESKNSEAIARVDKVLKRRMYDFWAADKSTIPPALGDLCSGPKELITEEPYGLPFEVESMENVDAYRIEFSAQELESMYQYVTKSGVRCSHLNVLFAHIWSLIARAKELGDEIVSAYLAITLRTRLTSHKDFSYHAGCFVENCVADAKGNDDIVEYTRQIRIAINSFTNEQTPALLHELAHVGCASRSIGLNSGRNSIAFTTWIAKEPPSLLSFGGKLIHYDRLTLPLCNMVSVMGKVGNKDKWYENGCYVFVGLQKSDLEQVINNPELRKWR